MRWVPTFIALVVFGNALAYNISHKRVDSPPPPKIRQTRVNKAYMPYNLRQDLSNLDSLWKTRTKRPESRKNHHE